MVADNIPLEARCACSSREALALEMRAALAPIFARPLPAELLLTDVHRVVRAFHDVLQDSVGAGGSDVSDAGFRRRMVILLELQDACTEKGASRGSPAAIMRAWFAALDQTAARTLVNCSPFWRTVCECDPDLYEALHA